MAEDMIEFRLVGGELAPGRVRSHELAEVIAAAEDMIVPVIETEIPGIEKEAIIVGLSTIEPGSISLQFTPSIPDLIMPAYQQIAQAIQTGDYGHLPDQSKKAVDKVVKFTRRHDCIVQIFGHNGTQTPLATIHPEINIEETATMQGETTLYGMIVRVGGYTKPTTRLQVGDRTITCDTSLSIARELGRRLYDQVGVTGIAKWNARTLELEAFTIQKMTDYEETPITEAFEELRGLIGRYYDDIDDPDHYVAMLRSESGEREWELSVLTGFSEGFSPPNGERR